MALRGWRTSRLIHINDNEVALTYQQGTQALTQSRRKSHMEPHFAWGYSATASRCDVGSVEFSA